MMRKRTCSSPDPITTKRRNIPQQMESVEKPTENEEKVLLDLLVVEKIASFTKLKFAPGFCQELVSKTFADALRSFYSSEKVKLLIASTADSEDLENTCPDILLSIGGFSQLYKETVIIKGWKLKQAVEQIFARFPEINLKLEGVDISYFTFIVRDVLRIVADNVTINSVEVNSNYVNMLSSRELIAQLSANLEVLKLGCGVLICEEVDLWMSEEFWKTVSSCAKLVSLTVIVGGNTVLIETGHIRQHVMNCLERLKVTHFRTNLEAMEYEEVTDMVLVASTFERNENLRQLDLSCFAIYNYWDDPKWKATSLVLGRLDSLKICVKFCGVKEWESALANIFPALKDRARLKISVDFSDDVDEDEDEPSFDLCDEYEVERVILGVLQSSLKLLHEAPKSTSLRLLLLQGFGDAFSAKAIFYQALNQLSSSNEFRGLTMNRAGRWTRILFGNVNLMAKTRNISS